MYVGEIEPLFNVTTLIFGCIYRAQGYLDAKKAPTFEVSPDQPVATILNENPAVFGSEGAFPLKRNTTNLRYKKGTCLNARTAGTT